MATTTIQALIFSRDVFSADDAVAWASAGGYRSDRIDESDVDAIGLTQRDAEAFNADSFRVVPLRDGVQATIGQTLEGRTLRARNTRDAAGGLSASVKPDSWNAEARTIDVVLSNERTNSVEYKGWGGSYLETLSLEPGNVRLDRINNGAPFLIMHRGGDDRAQIGKFIEGSVRIEGEGDARELVGTVRFSDHLDEQREAHVAEIVDGIRRNISVGFEDHQWFVIPGRDGEPDNFMIYDWEPFEGSSVTMGADDGAKFRSAPNATRRSPQTEVETMPNEEPKGLTEADVEQRAREMAEKLAGERVNTAIEAHEARKAKIRQTGKVLGVDAETVDGWISDKEITAENARDLAFEIAAKRDDNPGGKSVKSSVTIEGGDSQEGSAFALRTIGSIMMRNGRSSDEVRNSLVGISEKRAGSAIRTIPTDMVKGFDFDLECRRRPQTMVQIAERCLEAGGIPRSASDHWSRYEVLERACKVRSAGMNTTSALPLLIADVSYATVQVGYNEVPVNLSWARRRDAPDFTTQYHYKMSGPESLEEIGEGEEYPTSTVVEGRESWNLVKYGRIFGITFELMLADKIGALDEIPMQWGKSANRRVRASAFGLLTTNPDLSDSVAIMAAARGNVDGTPSAVSVASIDAMRTRMVTRPGDQTGETDERILRHLIMGKGIETNANVILGRVMPTPAFQTTTAATAVPANFGMYNIVADPLFDAHTFPTGAAGKGWVGSDGNDVSYSWLEGEEGPQVFAFEEDRRDGVFSRVRVSFAASAKDWRGLDLNPGA